jgi:hypothetical protein
MNQGFRAALGALTVLGVLALFATRRLPIAPVGRAPEPNGLGPRLSR